MRTDAEVTAAAERTADITLRLVDANRRLASAEAERDALRATVERELDRWEGYGHGPYCTHLEERLPCTACDLIADLRAALDQPETTPSEGER